MNIFRLDDDPELAARYHNDRHCIKMILESAQLLSTAHHVLGSGVERSDILLRPTHENHPCAVWVRSSAESYRWLHLLLACLENHYTARYGKIHAYVTNGLISELRATPRGIDHTQVDVPPQCMPPEYQRADDPVLAYRSYYFGHKRHLAAWRPPDGVPPWWAEMARDVKPLQ